MKFIISFLLVVNFPFWENNSKELASTYINNYKDIAVQEMQRSGIPASIKLAQGLLESDWGRSPLANTANNHFGIKCGSYWSGGEFYKEDDDKDDAGNLIESCFRAFESAQESYTAHSNFLKDPKKEYRYGFLFDLDTKDYKAWANGLKKAGYATDPTYPQKLISIIERYDLTKFDEMAIPFAAAEDKSIPIENSTTKEKPVKVDDKPSSINDISNTTETVKESTSTTVSDKELDHTNTENVSSSPKASKDDSRPKFVKVVEEKSDIRASKKMPKRYVSRLDYDIEAFNRTRMVKAKGGETLQQLANAIGVSLDEILTYNEPYDRAEEQLPADVNIFIERKKRNYKGETEYHIVKEGETMESISQLYGIRLKSLYAKNRMPKGSTTIPGVKLSLQKTASLNERPKFQLKDSNRKHEFLFLED